MADIHIHAPDGSIASFPEGTADKTISIVMAKHYPAPQPVSNEPRLYFQPYDELGGTGQSMQGTLQNSGSSMPYGQQMKNVGNSAGAMIMGAANSIPFIDRGASALEAANPFAQNFGQYSKALEERRTLNKQNEHDYPGASLLGGVAGNLAQLPLLPVGGAAKGAGLLAKIGQGTKVGAGFGAVQGSSGTQDLTDLSQAAKDTAIGAGIGGVVGGASSGIIDGLLKGMSKIAGIGAKKPNIPTNDELQAVSGAAYKKAEDAGIVFNTSEMAGLRNKVQSKFADRGYHPANEPGAAVIVSELNRLADQPTTLKGLETVRRMAGNGYNPLNKSNNSLLNVVRNEIDDLVSASPTSGAMKEARDYYSRNAKLETVDKAVEKASLRAASNGSGSNIDNASRQNIRGILDSPQKSRGFSSDELGQMDTIVRGTPTHNALRLVGKLAPTGIVSGTLSGGAGYGLLGPLGAAIPLAGYGAKKLADGITQKNIAKLSDLIRAGGKMSNLKPEQNQIQKMITSNSSGLLSSLRNGSIAASEGYKQRRNRQNTER